MSFRTLVLPLLFLTALVACDQEQTGPQVETERCGCTDEKAINYEAEANCLDSSCLYFDDEQKNLNVLFTSTGCGACGIWGINCFEGYTDSMQKLAIPLAVHFKYGDPMITPTNDSFVALIKPEHSPYFTVGTSYSQERGRDRPHSCELSGKNALEMLESWQAEVPSTRLAINIEEVSGQLSRIHYAAEVNGLSHCKVSIYRVQDSMVFTQNAGWRNDIENWVHRHVLRESLTSFASETLSSEGDNYETIELPESFYTAYPKSHLVAVIWQEQADGSWQVLNAERTY